MERIGRFDESLRTCPDWDLWQRVARSGARFSHVPEVLARYHLRPSSACSDSKQLLDDGLVVIARGHTCDPRVQNPDVRYALGALPDALAATSLCFASWVAGLAIGAGSDVRELQTKVEDFCAPDLDADTVAARLFDGVLRGACRRPADWVELWSENGPRIRTYLQAMESSSAARGLARRAEVTLTRMILEQAPRMAGLRIGTALGAALEVTRPLDDIRCAADIERLHCAVLLEGRQIGTLQLPVFGGVVPGCVLADAIASQFAWLILGRFLETNAYPAIHAEWQPDGTVSYARLGCHLATRAIDPHRPLIAQMHEQVGWGVFLQELWGRGTWWHPDAPSPDVTLVGAQTTDEAGSIPSYELSGDALPPGSADQQTCALVTVGGAAVGIVEFDTPGGGADSPSWRQAITEQCGFELCRVAVRQALLGEPMTGRGTLRERLAEARMHRMTNGDVALAGVTVKTRSTWQRIGTSAGRLAMLPSSAEAESGSAVSQASAVTKDCDCIALLYLPDALEPASIKSAPYVRTKIEQYQAAMAADSGGERPHCLSESEVTLQLPILMYHRVAPSGATATARYRVAPQQFAEQLGFLREQGYYCTTLDSWHRAQQRHEPLPGKAMLLTFDDGYADFVDFAWPLLGQHGFTAHLFVVANRIGGTNDWDAIYGEQLPLLDWRGLRRLQAEGATIASHASSHRRLSRLTPEEVVCEAARSRKALEHGLGVCVNAIAYPHGDEDEIVRHLAGACGFEFGLTTNHRRCTFHDNLLALPRIEVKGSDTIEQFKNRLSMT